MDQRSSTRDQAEAALAMDKAAVQSAEINLGYTEIRAPFAGRIGRNQAPLGTLVSPANTVLNTLVRIDWTSSPNGAVVWVRAGHEAPAPPAKGYCGVVLVAADAV